MFMENTAPTKANLIAAKASLEFSEKGFELLDKKRNVLIREIMSYMARAKKIEQNIGYIFSEAYEALEKANILIGTAEVKSSAAAIFKEEEFNLGQRSVMGVLLKHINCEKRGIEPCYSFATTDEAIDISYIKFSELKYAIFELAEVENAVFELSAEIKKTQRKANSLENIQIPGLIEKVKDISEVLEEREREDFFRLKLVKKKNKRTAG